VRILIVASEAPPIVSGISRCVDRLTVGLRARGHHVDVISSVQIPRMSLGEWRISSLLVHLPRIARRLDRYDVVNLHGPAPTMSDVALALLALVPRRRRPPIVYTHHSALQIRGIERLCAVYDRLHRRIGLHAALTIATSRPYQDLLHTRRGPAVRLAPWGVDLRAHPLRPDRHPEPLRVLFVGQMRSYKGVDCLLKALVGQPGVDLTLIGSGPRLADYERLARRLGGGNVRFLGHVPDEVLHHAYDGSDVIVLPSVTAAEAFGLVVLEGMSAGCVPVVTDLPGVQDVVLDSGIVVPPHDVEALRQAVRSLADDRTTLAVLGIRARRRAELFSWEACVAEYEKAFVDVLTTARDRPSRLGSTGSARRRTGGGVGTIPRACTTAPPVRYHRPDPVVPAPRTESDRHHSAQPVEP